MQNALHHLHTLHEAGMTEFIQMTGSAQAGTDDKNVHDTILVIWWLIFNHQISTIGVAFMLIFP